MAHLYQYLASGGHALPLLSVRGVLDAHGKTIKRYEVRTGPSDYHAAVQLITYAMQQVTERGTAHAIADDGLGWIHAAGKTGTSDKQRDSWFAGFSGDRLAVAWVGRDDNGTHRPVGLVRRAEDLDRPVPPPADRAAGRWQDAGPAVRLDQPADRPPHRSAMPGRAAPALHRRLRARCA